MDERRRKILPLLWILLRQTHNSNSKADGTCSYSSGPYDGGTLRGQGEPRHCICFGERFDDSESEVDVPEIEETLRESPTNIHSYGSKSESQVENEQQSENRAKSADKGHPDSNEVSEDEKDSGGKATLDQISNAGGAESTGESEDEPKDDQVGDERPNDDQGSDDDEGDEGDEEGEDDSVIENIVGAHMIVISHWPVFKRMIETKGDDSSEMRFYISEVKWAAFGVLI